MYVLSRERQIEVLRLMVEGNSIRSIERITEVNRNTIMSLLVRFTRLSLAFSKKLENLAAVVALHVAHYNFVRVHGSLKVTPAMAAGVVDELWTIEDLYDAVMA